jgi:hypothetical protein
MIPCRTSWWWKILDFVKGVIRWFDRGVNFLKTVLSVVQKAISVGVSEKLDLIMKLWGLEAKLPYLVSGAAYADDIVDLSKAISTNSAFQSGPLKTVWDNLAYIPAKMSNVLLWVGTVMTVVESCYCAIAAGKAYADHRKIFKDVVHPACKVSHEYTAKIRYASQIMSSDTVTREEYEDACITGQHHFKGVAQTLFQATKSLVFAAEDVQTHREGKTRTLVIRLGIDIVTIMCHVVTQNWIVCAVNAVAAIVRHMCNLGQHYVEESQLKLGTALNRVAKQADEAQFDQQKYCRLPDLRVKPAHQMREEADFVDLETEKALKYGKLTLCGFLKHVGKMLWESIKYVGSLLACLVKGVCHFLAQVMDLVAWACANSEEVAEELCKKADELVKLIDNKLERLVKSYEWVCYNPEEAAASLKRKFQEWAGRSFCKSMVDELSHFICPIVKQSTRCNS